MQYKITFIKRTGYTRDGIHRRQTKSFSIKEERDR